MYLLSFTIFSLFGVVFVIKSLMKRKPHWIEMVSGLLFLSIVSGCDDTQTDQFLAILSWTGNHPALILAIVAALSPLISMIPVVGAPFALIFTKIGVAIVPVLKEIAIAVEKEGVLKARTVSESAAIIIGKAADNPLNAVGRVPGAKTLAEQAAKIIVRQIRKKKKPYDDPLGIL